MIKPENRAHITLPPFYLDWFRSRYPDHPLPSGVKLIAESLNALQGQRDASNLWHHRLNNILGNLNIKRCNSDYGLHIMSDFPSRILILFVNADDSLVGHNCDALVDKLLHAIQLHCTIKVKHSSTLHFLNWRII